MNDPTIRLETRPDVAAFVERVRERLADLTDEEREELVGGLEADLHELVADGGSVAELGDPRAYADELRGAAGLGSSRVVEPARPGATRTPLRRRLAGLSERGLDGAHRRWEELVTVPALRGAWEVVVALRPVWWVVRAWAAVQLLSLLSTTDGRVDVLPRVGPSAMGVGLLLVAAVLSVQIGRGRLWPGTHRSSLLPRLLLLGLNALAVLVLLVVAPLVPTQDELRNTYEAGVYVGSGGDQGGSGVMHDGSPVANIFPYDADGRPLEGVQLFDQGGRPLTVSRTAGEEWDQWGEKVTVTYPWFNGGQRLFNVFPLPRREQSGYTTGARMKPDAWTSTNPPVLPLPPLAAVPPAALPLPADEDETATSQGGAGAEADRDERDRTGEAAQTARDSENAEDR